MSKFFLDSDVIIELFRQNEETISIIEKLSENEPPNCSSLTLVEVKRGAKEPEKRLVDRFFNDLKVFPVDRAVAQKASDLIREWRNKGKLLQLVDACIAATCILNDFILFTYNKRDYPMKELKML